MKFIINMLIGTDEDGQLIALRINEENIIETVVVDEEMHQHIGVPIMIFEANDCSECPSRDACAGNTDGCGGTHGLH